MVKSEKRISATEKIIADQEIRIARMKHDDPNLPEARRLLDALREKSAPRRVLDLTRPKEQA